MALLPCGYSSRPSATRSWSTPSAAGVCAAASASGYHGQNLTGIRYRRHVEQIESEVTIQRVDFGRAGAPDRIHQADALAVAEALPDASLDAIYIDPPFGTGTVRLGRGLRYADRADDPDAFVTWLLPYLEHSRRTLTATGSLFVHLDYRAVHYVKVALDRLFGRDQFVKEIVWVYADGGNSARG